MNYIRTGWCVSLGVHALALGLLGYVGIFYHPAELPGTDEKQVVTLTLIAAPDDVPEDPPRPKPAVVASIPTPPPKPPELIQPLSPVPVTPAPVVVKIPAVKPALSLDVPVQELKTNPPPQVAAAVEPHSAPTPMVNPPMAAKRGDGSSRQPGDDATTAQPTIGVRAQPDYRKNPPPPYPASANRRHQEGLVLLRVVVTTSGHAKLVELKQTSGYPVLDQAAINAVKDWEFDPARIGTTPLESEIEVPVRFELSK